MTSPITSEELHSALLATAVEPVAHCDVRWYHFHHFPTTKLASVQAENVVIEVPAEHDVDV